MFGLVRYYIFNSLFREKLGEYYVIKKASRLFMKIQRCHKIAQIKSLRFLLQI